MRLRRLKPSAVEKKLLAADICGLFGKKKADGGFEIAGLAEPFHGIFSLPHALRGGADAGVHAKRHLSGMHEIDRDFARRKFLRETTPRLARQAFAEGTIRQILNETNLLPSALVFIDDSDFELGEVQTAFPEAKCLRFPRDNTTLRKFLNDLQLSFARQPLTEEDKRRAATTRQNITFQQEIQQTHSLEEYLQKLEMRAQIESIRSENSDRALQLINKTNQFNLTGRRFTETEWKAFLDPTQRLGFQISFQDRNADYGVISVILVDLQGNVTDWVLSCRVFSRTLEHFILNEILEALGRRGIRSLTLRSKPTERNMPLYKFLKNDTESIGQELWRVQNLLATHVHKREPFHA